MKNNHHDLLSHITISVRKLSCSMREATPFVRRAFGRPAMACYILLRAHLAQLAMVALVPMLLFVAPLVVDSFTSTIFPPNTSKKLFGLLKTKKDNPIKSVADTTIMTTLWVTSGGAIVILFWLSVPAGFARATVTSRRWAAKAEELLSTNPSKAIALFKQALFLTTDPDEKAGLKAKLQDIHLSSSPQLRADETIINSQQETSIDINKSGSASRPATAKHNERSQVGPNGRYTLGSELGKGAMGTVYSAWDNMLNRKVALKELSVLLANDDEFTSRFRREAQALAQLVHQNVVQVYDLIEENNRLMMVLEFVDGGNLATYLKIKGSLSVSHAVGLAIPIARGLAQAHSQGIIHRDLKPANILLTSELNPKISDFGIARLSQSSGLTQVGTVLGSAPYMSPEQCAGDLADARADIYSLGITLYELLTGKVPFDGDTASVLAQHITENPRPLTQKNTEIPKHVEQIVMQMLAKNPDERPQDLKAVIHLLSPLAPEKAKLT